MADIVQDSESFTRHILKNRFLSKEDIAGVQGVLEDQLVARLKAADADGRKDANLAAYLFFQGAVMGMTIAYKQVKTHYENSAWEQGRNPVTGEEIPGHGNVNQT